MDSAEKTHLGTAAEQNSHRSDPPGPVGGGWVGGSVALTTEQEEEEDVQMMKILKFLFF